MGGMTASDIRLEPIERRHLPALAALLEDPAVLRFTRVPLPIPEGFIDSWLELYQSGGAEGTMAGFAVTDGAGEVLGIAVAPRIDRETRTAELGYVTVPAARGRGVARAALALLTDWAFRETGCVRLELMISPENPASQRVAERCGYVYEGTLRSLHFKQGLREDTQIWSRLAGDPEPE
jgi:RimJ/RimL family protein N-acetyltransferase